MKTNVQKHIMHNADGIGLYVGTYHKYNSGSTDGAYFDMTTFADAAEFFSVCKELHDDESEPELMVQDCQNIPSWMYRESMSAKQVQEIIDYAKASPEEKAKILCEVEEEEKVPSIVVEDYSEKAIAVSGETYAIAEQLKALGGAWNKWKKMWFISKKRRAEVEELVNKYAAGIVATVKEKESESKQYKQALADFCKAVNDCGYYAKERVGAVKIRDRYLLLDKPSIKTQFWFHDEGPNYEYYKTIVNSEDKMKEYFITHNLSQFDCTIKRFENNQGAYIALYYNDNTQAFNLCFDYSQAHINNMQPLTKDECESIKKALVWAKAQFRKRLDTYLKRYGTKKLDFDTYWADR